MRRIEFIEGITVNGIVMTEIIFEFFPEEYLELQKEIQTKYHPKLHNILKSVNVNELDLKLAHIASYCEVALDGIYTLEQRIKLCIILKQKLILLREEEKPQIILKL